MGWGGGIDEWVGGSGDGMGWVFLVMGRGWYHSGSLLLR